MSLLRVCVRLRMRASVSACACEYECVQVRVRVRTSMSACKIVRAYSNLYRCLHMRVFMSMYEHIRTCASAHTRMCVHALWSARNPHSDTKHNNGKN